MQRADARSAARSVPLRLVGNIASHIRRTLPISDGPSRTEGSGGPLHHREEHPEDHRTAVSRRLARRDRTAEATQRRKATERAAQIPGEAKPDAAAGPCMRVRELPHHRLPRATAPGDGSDSQHRGNGVLPHRRRPVLRHRSRRISGPNRRNRDVDDGPHHEQPTQPGTRRDVRPDSPQEVAAHPPWRRVRSRLERASAARTVLVRAGQSAVRRGRSSKVPINGGKYAKSQRSARAAARSTTSAHGSSKPGTT